MIVIGPGHKLELELYLVKQMFLDNENILLRVKIELEPSDIESNKQVAAFQLVNYIGKSHFDEKCDYPVFASTSEIDFGYEAATLNVNKREHSLPG